MSDKTEEVLCIRRWFFEKIVDHYFRGEEFLPYDLNQTCNWTLGEQIAFVPRNLCETDPTWLQIIPYLLVSSRRPLGEGKNVLAYRRTKLAGEKRLHGKHSIGFGGHINRGDTPKASWSMNVLNFILRCAGRELREEIEIGDSRLSSLGWLFEDTTEVGTVHVGAVILVELEKPEAKPRADEVSDLRFIPADFDANWLVEVAGLPDSGWI